MRSGPLLYQKTLTGVPALGFYLPLYIISFSLEKLRQNRPNDLLLDHMLEIFAGEKIESVALQGILDTFACRLCWPCWVGCILPNINIFLLECQEYCRIEGCLHAIPDKSVALYSDWYNRRHISLDLFIPHSDVSVGSITVHPC